MRINLMVVASGMVILINRKGTERRNWREAADTGVEHMLGLIKAGTGFH